MSGNPKNVKSKKTTPTKSKKRAMHQEVPVDQEVAKQPVAIEQKPDYPQEQSALPLPPTAEDKKVINGVEKLMELSFLTYLKELKTQDRKNDIEAIQHLNTIISEYMGPYLLIGYSPDNEPVEVLYAPTSKDKEALLERMRRTIIRHLNANAPG